MSDSEYAAPPCSAFVLIERGGSYDAAWETMVMVSLDSKPLHEMADAHHKKQRQSRIKLVDRTYMEVEEVPFIIVQKRNKL